MTHIDHHHTQQDRLNIQIHHSPDQFQSFTFQYLISTFHIANKDNNPKIKDKTFLFLPQIIFNFMEFHSFLHL